MDKEGKGGQVGRKAVVVMGVSGCGKSRVGQALAARWGARFVDGDDLHDARAVAKMRSGTPLTDDDRWPWLDRVGALLASEAAGVVVACSALRRAYRDRLRAACPGVRFAFLDGTFDLIAARMSARQGHYMPTTLLRSQFEALERPGQDETDVACIDIAATPDEVAAAAAAALESPTLSGPRA